MVYFQTKNTNLGKFWRMKDVYLLVIGNIFRHIRYILLPFRNSVVIGYILLPFGNIVVIWYISPRFGLVYQQKSGNPGVT
jgi:hypothetical protein